MQQNKQAEEIYADELAQSEGKKGKGGGYHLSRPPSAVSVGELIRVLDVPLALLPCVSQTAYRRCDECVDERTCGIRSVMKETRDAIVSIMERVTLAELCDRARKLEQEPLSHVDFVI